MRPTKQATQTRAAPPATATKGQPAFVNVATFAAMAGLRVTTINRLLREGHLVSVMDGRTRMLATRQVADLATYFSSIQAKENETNG